MTDQRMAYGPDEAARLLGIGRSTLYTLMRTGEIPSVLVGARNRRITAKALADYLARLEGQAEW